MNFSSASFLFYFLILTLALYSVVPKKLKNGVLLIASLLFYFVGESKLFWLLPLSALFNWLIGRFLSEKTGKGLRKFLLILSVVGNVGMLALFKYADFLVSTLNTVTGWQIPLPGLALPVGISFYTFQAMSYTVDVYRGQAKIQKNPLSFATYLCLFPQLIAGPIVRYSDVEAELADRPYTLSGLSDGILRFTVGLAKKVLLANQFGEICTLYAGSGEKSLLFAWMSAIAYTLQIYFDFSGYSDMAIGMGKMFGFHFPENFDYPYISGSITEFWRRWHMTLSGWFRDYVYIPLGGNRKGLPRQIVNLLIVWMLTGLWHGAAWNFLLWGLLYGVLLILEKLFLLKWVKKFPVIGHLYTLLFVVLGFVLFSAATVGEAGANLATMFGFGGLPLLTEETLYYLMSFGVLFVLGIVGSTPVVKKAWARLPDGVRTVAEPILMVGGLAVVTAYLVDGSFNPFLYFRF
ncbi:MAG: MBOAT family O-acyltransferase [Eubacteriales bacterium]